MTAERPNEAIEETSSEAEPQLEEAEAADPESALAEAQAKADENWERYLRAAAETDNVRKRSARDVENAHKFALEKFTGDLLPVLDSLEKAIEAGRGGVAQGANALTEGVELSLKLFLSVLEKTGVMQLDPLGEPFDPQVHEAIAMVPNPNSEPNSVMEVMQKGYTLNGRVVRAAKVVVASAVGNA